MRGVRAIFLPVAFLLLLSSSQGSAEESLDGSNPPAEDSSAIPMLRLGKRSDHSATDDEEDFDLATSPEFLEYVSEHLYPFAHPSDQQLGEDVMVDDLGDDGEVYNSLFDDNVDDDGDEESLEQQLQFWRPDSSGSDKRQDERSNDQFTADGQWSSFPDSIGGDDVGMVKRQASPYQSPMSGLRLGKRPMKMLRLGKRPMKMLRLGKRPMKMLRLGKRPMKMLRLGKRPMKMLRLGKRPMKILRLGKRPMKMLRLGKRPMKMLRLGKRPMKMLRLGKRSTEAEESLQSVASA